MLISDQGTLVRTTANDVSLLSRNTQGVRLIRLAADARLVGVQRIVETMDERTDSDVAPEKGGPENTGGPEGSGAPEASH